jgi:hypothetical protein
VRNPREVVVIKEKIMNAKLKCLAIDWLREFADVIELEELADVQVKQLLNEWYEGGYPQFVEDTPQYSEADEPAKPSIRIEFQGTGETAKVKGFVGGKRMETIIKEKGWEEGYHSFGSVRFLKKVSFTHRGRSCAYLVGIVTRANTWDYCWDAFLHDSQLGGGDLGVDLTAPYEDVYARTKGLAIQRIDERLKEFDELLDGMGDYR